MKPKLCYILPRYETADASHFSHIHDFLKEIGGIFDIYLIIEKGSKPPTSIGYTNVCVIKSKFILFRIIETKLIILKARFLGYKDFYVHYSFISAFLASVVTMFFGGRVFYWNCGEPWKYKRNIFREVSERLVYKLITHLVTGAPSLADEYAKHYRIKRDSVLIMPNWIDLRRFKNTISKEEAREKLNITQDSKVVLFAHHLSPRKGSRMILPVAKNIIDKYPNVIFIIAGSGPDDNFLLSEINNSGFKKNIRLVGAIANKELPDYFVASDVFFMPSEEEGFPRVLLESMALGIPFVGSDVGAVLDITPAFMKQYIVSSGNTEEFAKKIDELMSKNKNEQSEISENLTKSVTKYSVSAVVLSFQELFS